jgi:hypothetical protein
VLGILASWHGGLVPRMLTRERRERENQKESGATFSLLLGKKKNLHGELIKPIWNIYFLYYFIHGWDHGGHNPLSSWFYVCVRSISNITVTL